MPAHLAESPLTCVAVGSGRSLEEFEAIHRSKCNCRNNRRQPQLASSAVPIADDVTAIATDVTLGASLCTTSGRRRRAFLPRARRSLPLAPDRVLRRVPGGACTRAAAGRLSVVAPIQEGARRALSRSATCSAGSATRRRQEGARPARHENDQLTRELTELQAAAGENAPARELLRINEAGGLDDYTRSKARVNRELERTFYSKVQIDKGTSEGVALTSRSSTAPAWSASPPPGNAVVTLITDGLRRQGARSTRTTCRRRSSPPRAARRLQLDSRGDSEKDHGRLASSPPARPPALPSLYPRGIRVGTVEDRAGRATRPRIHVNRPSTSATSRRRGAHEADADPRAAGAMTGRHRRAPRRARADRRGPAGRRCRRSPSSASPPTSRRWSWPRSASAPARSPAPGFGFAVGLLVDVALLQTLGVSSLLLAVGYGAGRLRELRDPPTARPVAVGAAARRPPRSASPSCSSCSAPSARLAAAAARHPARDRARDAPRAAGTRRAPRPAARTPTTRAAAAAARTRPAACPRSRPRVVPPQLEERRPTMSPQLARGSRSSAASRSSSSRRSSSACGSCRSSPARVRLAGGREPRAEGPHRGAARRHRRPQRQAARQDAPGRGRAAAAGRAPRRRVGVAAEYGRLSEAERARLAAGDRRRPCNAASRARQAARRREPNAPSAARSRRRRTRSSRCPCPRCPRTRGHRPLPPSRQGARRQRASSTSAWSSRSPSCPTPR